MPNLKVLVDAFPTAARHVAELALANMNLDRGAADAMKADALGEVLAMLACSPPGNSASPRFR